MTSAMGATVHGSICFDTVADDTAATVFARRGQRLNGAFKAIERVRLTSLRDLKGFIILIVTGFAPCHHDLLPMRV